MNFEARIQNALSNKKQKSNFRSAMDYLRSKRSLSIEDPSEFERVRAYCADVRKQAIHRLPELLEQLEENCLNNGIQVHWARDTQEAQTLILDIVESRKADKLVKGKSMASEEIELNDFLEKRGIESLESDMGEYIVQLAQEKPSHIIMPAIHKSQEEIADLFENSLEANVSPDDVDQLIGLARDILRTKFEHAHIGLSGVNFAIAEAGALCLVENEGNGRMSTAVPPVHIALMGIEKVIPSFRELGPLLHVLTRSATGQDITSYINLISSPRRESELDGPDALHLVLLDNGRSNIAQHEALRETLSCIRCGACMNHCPVYTRIGGHAYGSTYPGPIGQMIAPQLNDGERHAELVTACSLNGACGEVCPVGIPITDIIRQLREHNTQQDLANQGGESLMWSLWEWGHTHPRVYRLLSKLLRLPLARRLFPSAWTKTRVAPRAGKKTLHERMRERNHEN